MSLRPIEQLLINRIGLDPASIGESTIASAIKQRFQLTGKRTDQEYLELLNHSASEFAELVTAAAVPETWFFREREAFVLFVELARERLNLQTAPLRILCIPCCTGEEPYSIAMALDDAGIGQDKFQLDAFDVCPSFLHTAAQATYRANSFRGSDLAFRSRYFAPAGDVFRLRPEIVRTVHFQEGNLTEPLFLSQAPPYDFIFCRNLFIYLHPAARQQAMNTVDRLLSPNGILFMGSCEIPTAPGFHGIDHPQAFAFCRAPAPDNARSAVIAAPSRLNTPTKPVVNALPSQPTGDPLSTARALADRGQLGEAAQLCRACLAAEPTRAEAHYLLGVIEQSHGNDQAAEDALRKAVFLNSEHEGALVYLMLLAKRRGDGSQAAAWQQRIERLRRTPGDTP